jgi:hypothetical protein
VANTVGAKADPIDFMIGRRDSDDAEGERDPEELAADLKSLLTGEKRASK